MMGEERKLIDEVMPTETREKLQETLSRLLPLLKPGEFKIVGGLAIRHHLLAAGYDYPYQIDEIDLIAKGESSVSPELTKDFLVYHHHYSPDKKIFYLAIVDPVTSIKIDIFTEIVPEGSIKVNFNDQELEIASLEDQLVKTVLDIQRISEKSKIKPKELVNAKQMAEVADMVASETIWKQRKSAELPNTIVEAIDKVAKIAQEHPEYLSEEPHRKPEPYQCSECVDTPDFPLSPMEKVYRILGYVE